MSIKELTDQKKSVMLADLLGQKAIAYRLRIVYAQNDIWTADLYDPDNIPLALSVLSWALAEPTIQGLLSRWLGETIALEVYVSSEQTVYHGPRWWMFMAGHVGIDYFLDTIISLATDAGLIKLEDTQDDTALDVPGIAGQHSLRS